MVGALLATAAAPATAGPVDGAGPSSTARTAPAVPDGTFELHRDGFRAVGAARVRLGNATTGRGTGRSLVLRNLRRGGVATTTSSDLVGGAHAAGDTFRVQAFVRATRRTPAVLRVREQVAGTTVASRRARMAVVPARWRKVSLNLRTTVADSTLVVSIRALHLPRAHRLFTDDVSITRVAGKPGTKPGTDVAGKLTNGCTYSSRGIPSCGTLVGAAHGSNTVPTDLESALGGKLGLRRTYYTASQVSSAVRTASADLAAGRLPWISFKLPHSWPAMVAGAGDAWAIDLATRLAQLDGPVWVAFHHEPEGDGDIQQWRLMQERLAPIIRSHASNVAFTVVVTGWNQFYGDAAYSLAQIWPRGVKVDVAGFDIYQQYGVVKNGATTTKWTDFTTYYEKIAAWAAAQGVEWGLAETGVTDVAAAARPSEIPEVVAEMEQFGGIAYSYFDSHLNSIAPWGLAPAPKMSGFASALAGSPRLS